MRDDSASASGSSSESDERERTLFCLRSEVEKALTLVCLEVFEFLLDILAALEPSQGGETTLDLAFCQDKLSLP